MTTLIPQLTRTDDRHDTWLAMADICLSKSMLVIFGIEKLYVAEPTPFKHNQLSNYEAGMM